MIRGFNFSEFKNAILQQLNSNLKAQFQNYERDLKLSIFDTAAENDGGKSDELFESDERRFNNLVRKGINWLKQKISEQSYRSEFDNFRKAAYAEFEREFEDSQGSSSSVAESSETAETENSPISSDRGYDSEESSAGERFINGKGIIGTYVFEDTENGGYIIKSNFNITAYRNQACKAFTKGMTNDFGISHIEPDKNGYYRHRSIVAQNYSALQMTVTEKGQEIAGYTAIYNDLKEQENNGKTLSTAKQNFMHQFLTMLNENGLKINNNGELEDIEVSRKKRKN